MNNRVYIPAFIFLFVCGYSNLFARGNKYEKEKVVDPFRTTSVARIGDYPFPTNPMNDRAIGYLLQGKINNGIYETRQNIESATYIIHKSKYLLIL